MKKLILLFAIIAQTSWGQIEWNAPTLTISGTIYQVDSTDDLHRQLDINEFFKSKEEEILLRESNLTDSDTGIPGVIVITDGVIPEGYRSLTPTYPFRTNEVYDGYRDGTHSRDIGKRWLFPNNDADDVFILNTEQPQDLAIREGIDYYYYFYFRQYYKYNRDTHGGAIVKFGSGDSMYPTTYLASDTLITPTGTVQGCNGIETNRNGVGVAHYNRIDVYVYGDNNWSDGESRYGFYSFHVYDGTELSLETRGFRHSHHRSPRFYATTSMSYNGHTGCSSAHSLSFSHTTTTTISLDYLTYNQ